MADDSSQSGQKEPDSSEGGRIWRGLRSLLFGNEGEQTLRKELEDAIDEYDEDEGAKPNNGDLSPVERPWLYRSSQYTNADIMAIEESASFQDLVALFADAGHSRIPVYKESLDTIVGMIHIRDAFAILASNEPPPKSLSSLIRQPLYVPETMGVLDLLAEMRAKRTHLAIVLDEYSGTEGLVTIEDLVEEIVGDIEDEHDEEPEAHLIPCEDGIWEADARAELDDVAKDIDPAFGKVEEDVDTLGGLAFVIAGHVPEAGEVLIHEESGWRLEILEGDIRRVTRLRLHPPVKEAAEE